MKIALLSDTRVRRGHPEEQALLRARLDRLTAAVNAAKVDMILIAGNLTQNGRPEEITDFQTQIKRFKAPVRYAFGPLDIGGKRAAGQEGIITAARVARMETSLGPSFWAEAVPGARIVAVNSTLFGSGLSRERDQWGFLGILLARPFSTPTLLLTHDPPYVRAADEPGGPHGNLEPKPRARLLTLLQRGGVRAVLAASLRTPSSNRREGIVLITPPPVSPGGPPARQPQGWTLVTVSPNGDVRFSYNLIIG